MLAVVRTARVRSGQDQASVSSPREGAVPTVPEGKSEGEPNLRPKPPETIRRLVDRFDQNRDAADSSQLTAYSLRPSDSEPSAVSRKPMAATDGQVYEQFLGKVIKLTDGHRAKVEEKPEVRKAGGVYYTPTYIVDIPSSCSSIPLL